MKLANDTIVYGNKLVQHTLDLDSCDIDFQEVRLLPRL